jgi:hypothetical protein
MKNTKSINIFYLEIFLLSKILWQFVQNLLIRIIEKMFNVNYFLLEILMFNNNAYDIQKILNFLDLIIIKISTTKK